MTSVAYKGDACIRTYTGTLLRLSWVRACDVGGVLGYVRLRSLGRLCIHRLRVMGQITFLMLPALQGHNCG